MYYKHILTAYSLYKFSTFIVDFFITDYTFLYKQLASDLSPKICLHFPGFRASELLTGCLVV